MDNNNAEAAGWSICSFKDNYNRKLGNQIARGRAEKALRLKKNIRPTSEEIKKIFNIDFKGVYIS